MDAYKFRNQKDRKAMQLKRRQDKLRQLLQEETTKYEAELRGLSVGNYNRLESMRERGEELKTSRESARKQVRHKCE